ncbi:MAG: endonuclease V [Candidatus Bipolaricaulota bacterium]|nr:endonuclease V [Candidatus Bipolaricaulota bacterium]
MFPSYLAFRELPVMLALLHKLKDQSALADMTFVDGTGKLHHRQAGIASQLGVMLDIPQRLGLRNRSCTASLRET